VICGVDEAGKGSVFGPMVIAAVAVSSEADLDNCGMKDSKVLSPRERERLFPLIQERCRVATICLDAQDIDAARQEMTMNAVVARAHAQAIDKLAPDIAYVDACDVNAPRYAVTVKSLLDPALECRIIAEHHADQTFPVVSAASIVAKVTRDRAIDILAKKYGEIGSGYPSDPITIRYLTSYIEKHRVPPPFARKSWKTVSALLAKKSQKNIFEFR
jgi:ribonuclease HII